MSQPQQEGRSAARTEAAGYDSFFTEHEPAGRVLAPPPFQLKASPIQRQIDGGSSEAPFVPMYFWSTLTEEQRSYFRAWLRRSEPWTLEDFLKEINWQDERDPREVIAPAPVVPPQEEEVIAPAPAPDEEKKKGKKKKNKKKKKSSLEKQEDQVTTEESDDEGWSVTKKAPRKPRGAPRPSDPIRTGGQTIYPQEALANPDGYGTHEAAGQVTDYLIGLGMGEDTEFTQVRIDNNTNATGRIYIGNSGSYFWSSNISHLRAADIPASATIYWFNPASGWEEVQ